MKKIIRNWGNFPISESEVKSFDSTDELPGILTEFDSCIVRGNGRCYGDSSMSRNVISTLRYNKVLEFDKENGIFECQSGVTLDEILTVIVPAGWFLPVTPGTKFITVGGAVASDIHGKNHHVDGSFSNHIEYFNLLTGNGDIERCSKNSNPEIFEATCGGMGLTGIILSVRFRLKKIETSYINQRTIKTKNLEETLEMFDKYQNYTYSVAWIDCLKQGKSLGRSHILLGEHALVSELNKKKAKDPFKIHNSSRLKVPFDFPGFVLNSLSVKLFNTLYYNKNFKKDQNNIVHYDPYFYPLDNVLEWNRIYGKNGFIQYQFVIPLKNYAGLKEIIKLISKEKMGSFLSVLKLFGPQDDLISFPMHGYTLAIDFKRTKKTMSILEEMDQMVLDFGGRLYLTKDARMDKTTFWKSYPNASKFQESVKKINPTGKFSSLQSDRLNINP